MHQSELIETLKNCATGFENLAAFMRENCRYNDGRKIEPPDQFTIVRHIREAIAKAESE